MSNYISIDAIEYHLPEQTEDNLSLQADFPGKIDEALLERIGIRSRHLADKGTIAADLAFVVSRQLFDVTGFDRMKIDGLVYCSGHRNYLTPATSCLLQDQLGLSTGIGTFDLLHACSGYAYGLATVKGLMQGVGMKHVLLVTAALPGKYLHPKNPAVRLVFGDAASATLFSATGTAGGIGEFVFGTDGSGYEKIIVRDGWDASPYDAQSVEEHEDEFGNVYTDTSLYIDSQHNMLFIMKQIPLLIEETVQKNKMCLDDIDLFVLHQSNRFAMEQVRKKLNVHPDRFFYSMETTGNTVQSTIPIALKDAMDQGRINKGTKVLVAGFGSGLSWAATVLTF